MTLTLITGRPNAGKTAVLDGWIAELWSLHGDGRRLVQPAAREILMRRACGDVSLRLLSRSASTPGFARTLSSVAERALDITQARPRTAEGVEVLSVLSRYTRILDDEGLIEPCVASRLLGADPPALDGPIVVNRFTDLSPAQESLVTGLATATDVLVALVWEEGHPGTEALTPLVARLKSRGEHVHVPAAQPCGELEQLEHALYRPDHALAATGAVWFAEAAGRDLEVVAATDLAAEYVKDGTPAGRIAIVFRDAASRLALMEAAARQVDLPLATDVSRPLDETPMGRALLALLDVAGGRDVTRERVLAFLDSPYSGVSPQEVERLDTGWRRNRISGDRLLRDVGRLDGAGPATRAARAIASGATPGIVNKWQVLIDALLVSADMRRGLDHDAGLWDCAVHREALRTIGALADDTGQVPRETEIRAALPRVSVSPGVREDEDAVLFTEAHRVRSRRFDVVVVGGLTAAEFSSERPRSAVSEILEALGLPVGADERALERLLFYTLVTRPRKRLALLRQATDDAGQAVRPSGLWDEVLDLYRAPDQAEPNERPAGLPFVNRPLSAIATDSVSYTPGRRSERAKTPRPSWRPSRGTLVSQTVREALAGREEFAVSELELYATCPYRWFYERAVRPREIDTGFEAREAGSLAHELLASFYARWSPPERPRRVTPDDLSEARELLEQVLAEKLSAAPDAVGLAETLTLDRVKGWVETAIEDDAFLLPGYVPFAHELAFGREADLPFEFGGVPVRGRIDRVDMRGTSIVVTDYKTASSVPGHGSFASRGVMQPPVYLAAAAAVLGGEPDGAVLRSLRSRTVRGFWRDDRLSLHDCGSRADAVGAEQVASILEEAAGRVAAAAEGIRSGNITPVQGGCATCSSCVARGVCGQVTE